MPSPPCGFAPGSSRPTLAFSPAAEARAPHYADIRAPLVIVVGDADSFNPEQQAHSLHETLPHSTLVRLSGAGHMLPHMRPDAVIEAINLASQQASMLQR